MWCALELICLKTNDVANLIEPKWAVWPPLLQDAEKQHHGFSCADFTSLDSWISSYCCRVQNNTCFYFFQSGCAQAEIGPGERADGLASSKSFYFFPCTNPWQVLQKNPQTHWETQTPFLACSFNNSVTAVPSLSKAVSYPPVRMFWKLLAESTSGDDLGEQSADWCSSEPSDSVSNRSDRWLNTLREHEVRSILLS